MPLSARRQMLEAIATQIVESEVLADVDDPRAEVERINRRMGWTYDSPIAGQDPTRNWLRHEGVQLSDTDLADAYALAEHWFAGDRDWLPDSLRMGRPRQHATGSRRRVTLELPADLLEQAETSGDTLTEWIADAMRIKLNHPRTSSR